MLEVLARNRSWLYVRGAAAVVLGVSMWIWGGGSLLAIAVIAGVYALIDGAATLVLALHGPRPPRARTWVLTAVGVVGLVGGVAALYWAGSLTFDWPALLAIQPLVLVALWALARGVLEIIAAIQIYGEEWLLAVAGGVSVAFSVLLAMLAGSGLLALSWLIGFYAIVAGIAYIALGVRLGHIEKHLPHAPHAA